MNVLTLDLPSSFLSFCQLHAIVDVAQALEVTEKMLVSPHIIPADLSLDDLFYIQTIILRQFSSFELMSLQSPVTHGDLGGLIIASPIVSQVTVDEPIEVDNED